MNKIIRIVILPIMIFLLFIMSNTILFASANNNKSIQHTENDKYIPSRFAFMPYASIGYFTTDYNCDVNLFDGSNKLEAEASTSLITVVDKDTSFLMDYSYTVGAKFEIRVFKSLIFTPEIEFQQNKIRFYTFNDDDLVYSEIPELDVGYTSRYINIPLMLNFYYSSSYSVSRFIGIGPKIHYNITKEKDKIFPVNPYFISGSVVLGLIAGDEVTGSGLMIGLVADKTITNIYKDEDFISNYGTKVSSIFGKNFRIGAMMGLKFSIIK